MIIGTVSVTAGIASGVGLSKELYDGLQSAQGIVPGPQNDTPLQQLAKFANTIAQVVVAHIQAHATVATTDTGIVAAGIPVATAGSPSAQVGATTATGVVTANGTGTVT